jgi:hypothetical protein
MNTLPDQIVAQAFALSSARGADLLTTMRGDNPRSLVTDDEPPAARPEMRAFLDTIVLARAIELLQPDCRAALSVVYAERKATEPSTNLDGQPGNAQPITTNCEKPLLEIHDSLKASAHVETTVPQWVSEREHAAAGDRRR